VGSAGFRWLTLAFALSAVVTTGVAVHLIPLLLERGHSAAFAGAAMGTLGLAALPGRLVFTPLGDVLPRRWVTASIFLLQMVAMVLLLASGSPVAVWLFVVLFGIGFGAITPARAALVGDAFGRTAYGAISGAMVLVLALARASAPVGASVLHRAAGGYGPVLQLLAVACLISALAILRLGKTEA
jgi:MFS family permease